MKLYTEAKQHGIRAFFQVVSGRSLNPLHGYLRFMQPNSPVICHHCSNHSLHLATWNLLFLPVIETIFPQPILAQGFSLDATSQLPKSGICAFPLSPIAPCTPPTVFSGYIIIVD